MPRRVKVPGHGTVNFPDSMSLQQVQQAVAKLLEPTMPHLEQKQPGEFMPDAFPEAQGASQHIAGPVVNALLKAIGGPNARGINLGPYIRPLRYLGLNIADPTFVHPDADQQDVNATAAHEAAHTVWDNLDEETKNKWRALHKKDPSVAGFDYRDKPDHAFPEAYGLFAAYPNTFQKGYPDAYKFMKDLSGFEYARPGKSMTPQ